MLPKQKAAVVQNMDELIAALKHETPVFINYLVLKGVLSYDVQELIVSESSFSSQQLLKTFLILQETDSGWPQLLCYLRNNNNKSSLADKLQNDADGDDDDKSPKRSALEEFSVKLANYYQSNYANVPTMFESPKHVKDVWVPLQIDGKEFVDADRIDHVERLNRLKSHQSRNVALIKGDPGMGKTTLAKKIAYDWAINYGSTSSSQQFTLVLAVPLRYLGKSNPIKFDQLAIDYFVPILEVENLDEAELVRDISLLKSQLLVILDGLDEYSSYAESPFRFMFKAPFQHTSTSCNVHAPTISFKLIITSRPYACERVNDDFWPLRFVILPLETNHLSDFVNIYCQTSEGIAKVTEYLKVNAQLVIKVPLILTFVCYLADSVQEIPTNMTTLYGNLIQQMIRRENHQGKLVESVDVRCWQDSHVVKTTGALAFREINDETTRSGNFEFPRYSLEKSQVTNDSFICGFLLHKFNFASDTLNAEFPHRSIQEFFAALHAVCCMLMFSGGKKELRDIRQLTVRDDSQFGRFLFGICSLERKFVRMTNWLNPSLGGCSTQEWSLTKEINNFGANLLDCSPEENILIGQILRQSAKHLGKRITSHIHMYLSTLGGALNLDHLSADFKGALHLVNLSSDNIGLITDWCVADDDRLARLAVVSPRLPALLQEQFDRISILIWTVSAYQTPAVEWETIFSQIRLIPPVKQLIISTMEDYDHIGTMSFAFVVRIRYNRMTSSELTDFRFGFDDKNREDLLEAIPENHFVELTEKERKIDEGGLINLRVAVESCESQSALIYFLIRQLVLITPSRGARVYVRAPPFNMRPTCIRPYR